MSGLLFKKLKPVGTQTSRVRKVTRACVWGSAGSNRKNDEKSEVWVRLGLTLKLEKGMSTCYRLGGWSSVQKVETREHPDLQGPKSYMCVYVGQCRFIPKKWQKGEVWVRWGLTLKLETGTSTCYRLGEWSLVQKVETREQPDLQGPKSYTCVCMGQCRF